jgi:hypothetical protein
VSSSDEMGVPEVRGSLCLSWIGQAWATTANDSGGKEEERKVVCVDELMAK